MNIFIKSSRDPGKMANDTQVENHWDRLTKRRYHLRTAC